MLREDCLDEAKEIITGDRQKAYGSAYNNFKKIAHLWSEYLDKGITIQDVANMMILLKIARSLGPEQKDDNYVDICGYAALASEMVWEEAYKLEPKEPVMSFNEYLDKIRDEAANDI